MTGTIKLSHFSVKEYFLSDCVEKIFRISESTSHSKISEISVAYLLQFQSFKPLRDAILDFSSLAQYAAEHWIDHAKSGGMDSGVLKLILQLFRSDTASLTNWVQIWNIDIPWGGKDLLIDKVKVHSPVYYAAVADLERLVYNLLEQGAEVNAQGGYFVNALQAASYKGHEAIVKVLLEKGAEINAQEGYYGNALQIASFRGHEAIVKVLLEKGADVNAQGGFYGNALQTASSGGHEGIVKVLLQKGAEINAQGGYYGNALQAASSGGHEAIMKVLLEKEAEINAQGGYYGNALQAASFRGHEAIVKVLLGKRADVNAQGGF